MKTINIQIPTRWNELTGKQLKHIASLFNLNCDQNEFLTYAFLYLSGLKVASPEMKYDSYSGLGFQWYKYKNHKPFILNSQQIAEHLESVKWLLELDETNPLKWIRGQRICNPRLYGVKLRQYLTIENFYMAYTYTQKESHLDKLLASLYKFPWEKYSDFKVNKRASRFKSVNKNTKTAVYLFVGGLRMFLRKQYPNLMEESGSNDEPDMKQQFRNIMRNLNKGDVTRNDAILDSDTHDALSELDALKYELNQKKEKKNV